LAQTFEYDVCTNCGARFLATRPLASELDKLYFPDYGPYQPDAGNGSDPGRSGPVARAVARSLDAAAGVIGLAGRHRLPRMLEWAYTPASCGDRLVDYGCGAPNFLNSARDRGWSTTGVDFTEEVLAAVRADGHGAFLV